MVCTKVAGTCTSLLTLLLAATSSERVVAQLTVASITPDPAPSGDMERLTLHMEGVTEAHLAGPRNSLRLQWPTHAGRWHTQALDGWPAAGSAPADGKVAVLLNRNTEVRWPETGPIGVRVRAEYMVSSELGWFVISTADCMNGTVGACTIRFADSAQVADQNATAMVAN